MEQDDVQVCVRVFTGNLAPGIILEFNVWTVDASAFGMFIIGQHEKRKEGLVLLLSYHRCK